MTTHPSKLSHALRTKLGLADAQCVYDRELHTGLRDMIETTDGKAARIAVASEVCLLCPVMAQCLDRAVSGSPEPGVWGSFEAETLAGIVDGAAPEAA